MSRGWFGCGGQCSEYGFRSGSGFGLLGVHLGFSDKGDHH